MKSAILRFGLIAGGIVTVLLFVPFFIWGDDFDMSIGEITGYASMLLAMCTVYFGIRHYRDNERGGIITFGKAMQVGLLISLVAGLVFYVANFIFYETMGDDFYPKYQQYYTESIKNSGKPAAEIEKELKAMQADWEANKGLYTNSFFQAFVMFATVFLIGAVISIISALILKRYKHKEAYQANN